MLDLDGDGSANARTIVVVIVGVALVAVQVGVVAFALGIGPFDGGSPGSGPAVSSGTAGSGDAGPTGQTGGSGGGSAGSGDGGTSEPPPYGLTVLGTERCGNTCRDVTVRLTNNRNETAEEVSVHTRIYAGNATSEKAQVWEGGSDVGALEAGASTTETARVSLSYFEAIDVKRKGGWITIETVVESEEVRRSFEERRKVA